MMEGELEKMVKKELVERNFVYSDIHYPLHNPDALDIADQLMKDYKPHRIILIGDAMDMTPVSHWLEDRKRPLEGKRLQEDYEFFNGWLNKTVKSAGNQLREVVYLKGNHEDWVEQYIDKHPEMEGMLEVENNIELHNKNVKLTFVKFNEFYKVGKLYMTHGLYTTKYHAAKMLDSVGKSVMYGHTHDVQIHTKMGMVKDEKHEALSIGCLCDMSPDYMKNRPNNWMHAVALVDVQKNGNFTPHIINIYDGRTVWNNKVYKSKVRYK